MWRGDGVDSGDAVDGLVREEGDEVVVYYGNVVGWWGSWEEVPGGINGRVCSMHAILDGAGVEEFCEAWADGFEISD